MHTKKIIPLLGFLAIWLGLVGIKFNAIHIITAVLVPILVMSFADKLSLIPQNLDFNFFKSIKYFLWLTREIIMSSIAVSKIAWCQNIAIYPSIQPIVSVQATELGIVIYANSITLTPGTVTLSTEDNKLLIHALDIKFMEDLQDGNMDRKISEIINQ